MVVAVLYFAAQSALKPLTEDINRINILLRDIASGRRPENVRYHQPLFNNLAKTAIALFCHKTKQQDSLEDSVEVHLESENENNDLSDQQLEDIEEINLESSLTEEDSHPEDIPEEPEEETPEEAEEDSSEELEEDMTQLLEDIEEIDLDQMEHAEDEEEPSEDTSPVPKSIFRAYDIRGIAGETLSLEGANLIGKAIGSEALSRGENTIIVANDGRLSSPNMRQRLMDGLTSTGCDVISIGTVPTPVLYFATHELEANSGVMITGSHNPAEYNGFKIMLSGETLAEDDIQGLYNRIQENDFSSGQGEISSLDITSRYQDRILDDVVLARPLKVVIDCGNGVAGNTAPQLFEQLGCDVIPLFCDVDGHFPNHHPDPGKPENLEQLIRSIEEENADIGIAFDGDGDRVGLVTNAGTIIHPDRLLMLLAQDVISRNPGADIIFDVKCSRHLNALISGCGGRPVMWKTGHSLIKRKMNESGALLAGEMSGHIFFKERWYGFDDGLYSAARLAEVLTTDNRDTETIFQELPDSISTPEITIPVDDAEKFNLIANLTSEGDFGEGEINTIDGIRVDYPFGWGLVRASNTTPALTLRFEADSQDELNKIQNIFRDQLLAVEPKLTLPF